ncbi:MAG: endospore germination permease [Bacillota bacterium]|nr:endospore germination permease [Bacillota bacterium]
MSVFGISGGTGSRHGRISNGQAVLILMGVVLSVTVFILPGPPALLAGSDAYWGPALATIPSIPMIALYVLLARRFGMAGPYEYLPRLLGRPLGKAVSALYVVFFLIIAASVTQTLAIVLGSIVMPLTPLPVFAAVAVLTAAYVAYLGIETFGRLAQLMMPLLLAVLVFITLALLPELDFDNMLPILRHGLMPSVRAAVIPSAVRSEAALALAFLLPAMRSPGRAFRVGVLATSVLGLLLVINAVTILGLVSAGEAARLTLPALVAARHVRLGRGIENIEILVIVPWLMALTMKVALYVFFAAAGIARTLDAPSRRPAVLPAAVLAGVLGGWMFPSARILTEYITDVWPGYAVTMNLLVPAVLLTLSVALGRKGCPPGAGQPGGDER